MNKSESKYFNTAICMDEALLALLEKKDLPYITVKEICEKAGVNRSTFYLHYETIDDLLTESIEYLNNACFAYMREKQDDLGTDFVSGITECDINELYLVTPKYLSPYLEFIKEHRKIFQTALNHSDTMRMNQTYDKMFRHVFGPILTRYQVPEQERKYFMAFYMNGLMAIITEWIRNNCEDTIEFIITMIQRCVHKHQEE